MILAELPEPVIDAGAFAGALIAVITLSGLLLRSRLGRWLSRQVAEDAEAWVDRIACKAASDAMSQHRDELPDLLDSALAFNGTGRFRSDMREFYLRFNAHLEHHREHP